MAAGHTRNKRVHVSETTRVQYSNLRFTRGITECKDERSIPNDHPMGLPVEMEHITPRHALQNGAAASNSQHVQQQHSALEIFQDVQNGSGILDRACSSGVSDAHEHMEPVALAQVSLPAGAQHARPTADEPTGRERGASAGRGKKEWRRA